MFDPELFSEIRTEFMAYLRFTKGYSKGTCYSYNSDLNIWSRWLQTKGKDWQQVRREDVERFQIWQMQDQGVGVPITLRRISCLSTFYRWAKKNEIVVEDPTYLIDKPKRPQRLPIWLGRSEQRQLEEMLGQVGDLPDNIFGMKREHVVAIRQRYEMLFVLMLNSGLRISEAFGLKVEDVRLSGGAAKFIRVVGKGDKERLIPLPAAFGRKFGAWLEGRNGEDYVFARQPGGKPPSATSARAYLQRLLKKAGITKKVTPHKLRHTYATRLLEAEAQLVDIQALLGHANLSTTQIYTHVDEDRMAAIVSKL